MSQPQQSRIDSQVVAASLHDPAEFAQIYDRHAKDIYRYLLRRLGSHVAEDLTADTFVVAFGSRARFDLSQPDARPWLYGIASNLAAKHRRKEARWLRAMARTGVDPVAASWVDQADQRVTAQALNRALARALADLSAGDRDVLLLVAWADFSYDEVALALDLPVGTVRSRLHRARRNVRAALPEPTPDPPRRRDTIAATTEENRHG